MPRQFVTPDLELRTQPGPRTRGLHPESGQYFGSSSRQAIKSKVIRRDPSQDHDRRGEDGRFDSLTHRRENRGGNQMNDILLARQPTNTSASLTIRRLFRNCSSRVGWASSPLSHLGTLRHGRDFRYFGRYRESGHNSDIVQKPTR